MDCKYQPLSPILEKRRGESFESSSTLGDLDDLEVPTSTGENPFCQNVHSAQHKLLASRWIWLVHAVLLMVSCTFFALAASLRSTTLEHVRQFSTWCKWFTSDPVQDELTCSTKAPAETAVRYDSLKYNITTKENRFAGAAPEVDKAWREISYDSKLYRALITAA